MTQINSHKVVGYSVEQGELILRSHKVVAYAVEQEVSGALPTADVHKIVAYSVEQPTLQARSHKVISYAVEGPDTSGNGKQEDPAKRPRYRTGVRPYIEFLTGNELRVNVLFGGIHTIIIYKPDDTFEIRKVNFTNGSNLLPVVNFNQMVIIRGNADHRLIERVRLSMRLRASP